MVTIEDAQKILDEVAESLPQELYQELNGGIILLPEAKRSREPWAKDLYILGEYNYSAGMGRYIAIYFGSFPYVFGENASRKKMAEELRETLLHEFRHHWGSLAGQDEQEKEDERQLYLHKTRYQNRARRIHKIKKR